ncbi:putative RNA polymerase ECF-type sigma factor [Sphingomonas changbaiensis NBRC 104936]|uniref:Putative RNA polymerase ECF-type sigma factor n=1 Tax=Sphingomonas changbaiensis NBRC 104936 TaxID=1219043 RepID=A0A0E9MU58_9SPHN|nr:RNA polymerase sigma factor [Sphingomonas changbaiensis]GAO40675.1 putative RNA polymerase ECF-type sigma factor [Sphingomonas changbaiensis NBRC 104936]
MDGQSFEGDMIALLPRLRRFAHALARSPADADDLCQASIERALKSRDQWQPGTRLDSWMYRIMRNLWVDEARARGRRDQTFAPEEAGAHVGDDGARHIELKLELTDLDRAMSRLPAEQREAIALVLVEGLAYKEAAAVLDVPIGTLTSRLSRGREALIAELGKAI